MTDVNPENRQEIEGQRSVFDVEPEQPKKIGHSGDLGLEFPTDEMPEGMPEPPTDETVQDPPAEHDEDAKLGHPRYYNKKLQFEAELDPDHQENIPTKKPSLLKRAALGTLLVSSGALVALGVTEFVSGDDDPQTDPVGEVSTDEAVSGEDITTDQQIIEALSSNNIESGNPDLQAVAEEITYAINRAIQSNTSISSEVQHAEGGLYVDEEFQNREEAILNILAEFTQEPFDVNFVVAQDNIYAVGVSPASTLKTSHVVALTAARYDEVEVYPRDVFTVSSDNVDSLSLSSITNNNSFDLRAHDALQNIPLNTEILNAPFEMPTSDDPAILVSQFSEAYSWAVNHGSLRVRTHILPYQLRHTESPITDAAEQIRRNPSWGGKLPLPYSTQYTLSDEGTFVPEVGGTVTVDYLSTQNGEIRENLQNELELYYYQPDSGEGYYQIIGSTNR